VPIHIQKAATATAEMAGETRGRPTFLFNRPRDKQVGGWGARRPIGRGRRTGGQEAEDS